MISVNKFEGWQRGQAEGAFASDRELGEVGQREVESAHGCEHGEAVVLHGIVLGHYKHLVEEGGYLVPDGRERLKGLFIFAGLPVRLYHRGYGKAGLVQFALLRVGEERRVRSDCPVKTLEDV